MSTVPNVAAAINALRMYGRTVARTAQTIADAGHDEPTPSADEPPHRAPLSSTCGASADMTQAMITILIAQRAVAANLRAIRAADPMAREAIDLPKDEAAR